jgi:hypothetical protein
MRSTSVALVCVWMAACKGGSSEETTDGTTDETSTSVPSDVVPAFGDGSVGSITVDALGSTDDGLFVPRDLGFNPDVPGELWVVNRADDSVSIFHDVGTADQTSEHRIDPYALHFMEEVAAIDFGGVTYSESSARTFGTCQESRNTYDDTNSPNDFMGPSLWTADLSLFGYTNPEAVEFLTEMFGVPVDLGSHLDMLHESPMCVGIAWEKDNVYWVFDGRNDDIVRYDFQDDHGLGYDDHSDGLIHRVTGLDVKRKPDVPSHMIVDQATKILYVVDTGNNRVLAIDTQTGTVGASLRSIEPGTQHAELDGVEYSVLIDGGQVGMDEPSGIALVDDTLLITDHGTGRIYAFDLDGALLAELDVERPGIMGIEAPSLSELWIVDADADELLRLTP